MLNRNSFTIRRVRNTPTNTYTYLCMNNVRPNYKCSGFLQRWARVICRNSKTTPRSTQSKVPTGGMPRVRRHMNMSVFFVGVQVQITKFERTRVSLILRTPELFSFIVPGNLLTFFWLIFPTTRIYLFRREKLFKNPTVFGTLFVERASFACVDVESLISFRQTLTIFENKNNFGRGPF